MAARHQMVNQSDPRLPRFGGGGLRRFHGKVAFLYKTAGQAA
jgi:hypothetical protein